MKHLSPQEEALKQFKAKHKELSKKAKELSLAQKKLISDLKKSDDLEEKKRIESDLHKLSQEATVIARAEVENYQTLNMAW